MHSHTKGQDTERQHVLLTVSFSSTAGSGQLKDVRVRHTTDIKVVPQGIHGEHLYIQNTRGLVVKEDIQLRTLREEPLTVLKSS